MSDREHKDEDVPQAGDLSLADQTQREGGVAGQASSPGKQEPMPVLPLRNIIFFPGQIAPLFVGRSSSVQLTEEAHRTHTPILVLTQKDSAVDSPAADDLFQVGTVVRIVKIYTMPDGSKSVVVEGVHRAYVRSIQSEDPYLKATIERLVEEIVDPNDVDIMARVANVRTMFKKLAGLIPEFNPEQLNLIMNTRDVVNFAYLVASMQNIPVPEKQDLLETVSIMEMLNKVTVSITSAIQRQELTEKIQHEVQEAISKNQREYFLREQLRAIKKELGEERDQLEIDEMRKTLEDANMSEEVRKATEKELDRLSVMNPAAAEYSVTRNYVDWLLEMPWSVSTEDNLDIKEVMKKLDADHYGLEKVKNASWNIWPCGN